MNSYLDSIGHGPSKVVICDYNGIPLTSPAHKKHWAVSLEELQKVAVQMKNLVTDEATNFAQKGITLDGVKYQFLKEDKDDPKNVLAKKKDIGSLSIFATKTCVIIAFTADGQQQGNTNTAMEKIAIYLIENSV